MVMGKWELLVHLISLPFNVKLLERGLYFCFHLFMIRLYLTPCKLTLLPKLPSMGFGLPSQWVSPQTLSTSSGFQYFILLAIGFLPDSLIFHSTASHVVPPLLYGTLLFSFVLSNCRLSFKL